jgi:lysophospholipase L1-like esterase
MNTFVRKSTALLLLSAVAACSGGSGSGAAPSAMNPMPATHRVDMLRPHDGSGMFANIVGVGDSLTAGYQSGGFLGALNVKNPLFAGQTIPPGQESGFWADLYEQATGFSPEAMYRPEVTPLPLIAGPGLDNQVVSSATTVFGTSKTGDSCTFDNAFDQSAFSLSGLQRVRLNANSGLVRDLGVPGITLHEASYMTRPLTPTCNALPGTAGLLSAVTNGESGTFYPVLGDLAPRLGPNLTLLASARTLQPSLVTIWLGANDVLKFMGSGGLFRGGDMTAAQTQADLQPMIRSFLKINTKVVVANLPDVLLTPYFMNVDIPSNNPKGARLAACKVNQYFYCLLVQFGQSNATAVAITTEVRKAYGLEPAYKCVKASLSQPCGYVTLPGALAIVSSLLSTGKIPSLDPHGPGSGLGGNYITPGFAGQIQVVNDNINAGINASAHNTGVPLVDVQAIFQGIASGDPSNQYFAKAQVNPGVCCSEVFLGGLVSFDGLHPSNTGYALISYYFIQTINTAFRSYGANVPETPIKAIYSGKPPYKFADPYAPQLVHDLEIVRTGNTATLHYAVPRRW